MRMAIELDKITFFGRSDHVDGFSRKDEEGGRELVTEKPELRVNGINIKQTCGEELERYSRNKKQITYVHGVVLLEGALICLSLAHEDDHRVRATEQRIPRTLVCLP